MKDDQVGRAAERKNQQCFCKTIQIYTSPFLPLPKRWSVSVSQARADTNQVGITRLQLLSTPCIREAAATHGVTFHTRLLFESVGQKIPEKVDWASFSPMHRIFQEPPLAQRLTAPAAKLTQGQLVFLHHKQNPGWRHLLPKR